MIFVNKKLGSVRKLERNGSNVSVSQKDGDEWEVLSDNASDTELTAQAFLHYLMLWHKDKGYERVEVH